MRSTSSMGRRGGGVGGGGDDMRAGEGVAGCAGVAGFPVASRHFPLPRLKKRNRRLFVFLPLPPLPAMRAYVCVGDAVEDGTVTISRAPINGD